MDETMALEPVLVEVACASAQEAARIGSSAVVQGLAVSAQHFAIASTYRWRGKVEHAGEELLRMTTTPAGVAALVAHVRAEHSYELPHVRVFDAPVALPGLREWVAAGVHVREGDGHRSRLCYVTVQVRDLAGQAAFWAAAVGGEPVAVSSGSQGRYAKIVVPGEGVRLLLQRVDDLAPVGRVHLDVESDDVEAEVARLVALGARVLGAHRENGFAWTVLADPEGNELCVLQPRHPDLLAGCAPRA